MNEKHYTTNTIFPNFPKETLNHDANHSTSHVLLTSLSLSTSLYLSYLHWPLSHAFRAFFEGVVLCYRCGDQVGPDRWDNPAADDPVTYPTLASAIKPVDGCGNFYQTRDKSNFLAACPASSYCVKIVNLRNPLNRKQHQWTTLSNCDFVDQSENAFPQPQLNLECTKISWYDARNLGRILPGLKTGYSRQTKWPREMTLTRCLDYTVRWSNFDPLDPKIGVFLQSTEATPCGNVLEWKLTPENPHADNMFMAAMAMVLAWKIAEDSQSFVINTKLWHSL